MLSLPWSSPPARSSLLVASVLALLGCGTPVDADAPDAPSPPPEVSVVTTRLEPLALTDELPGRVVAFRVTEVRPQVSGIVRRRSFTEGETVREGQPLYQIDAATFRANVAAASAALARSRAALAQAELHAERTGRLFDGGAAPQQSLDEARTGVALADAEVAQARAALQRAQLDLRYATIVAPIAGQIGISRISEGALVSPVDPQPLATIQQIDQVYVDLRQPAERAGELRAAIDRGELTSDGSAEVTILTSTGAPLEERGRVLFSDVSVDPGTGELTLRALVPNAARRLLPGMFVRARIARGERPDAILVPQQAVQRDTTSGAQVLVVGADGAIVVRRVGTGAVVDGRSVITEGVTAGDRVVVEGHGRLAPGTVVSPVEWQPPGDAPR